MKMKLNPFFLHLAPAITSFVAGKHIRNENTKRASLFVDFNEVPMHEIDLLLSSIRFSSSLLAIFSSFSVLRFCFVSLKLYIVSLHKFQSPESTNDRLFVFSLPFLRFAFADSSCSISVVFFVLFLT